MVHAHIRSINNINEKDVKIINITINKNLIVEFYWRFIIIKKKKKKKKKNKNLYIKILLHFVFV